MLEPTRPSPLIADPEQRPATGAVAGIDLGIKDFAVTSGGQKSRAEEH